MAGSGIYNNDEKPPQSTFLRLLRSRTNLTQKELAAFLGVTERVIRNWENNYNAPKAETLKHLIEYYLKSGVFIAGHEKEEGRQLWTAAKLLYDFSNKYFNEYPIFDVRWFDALLGNSKNSVELAVSAIGNLSSTTRKRLLDWGEAPSVEAFYGRDKEIKDLTSRIVEDRCRLVAVIGMGGIGKTSLVVKAVEQVKNHFDYIIWRSLQNTPNIRDLIAECASLISNQEVVNLPPDINNCISLLINLLRSSRCLLILDNYESVLRPGDPRQEGYYLAGFEAYGKLIERIAESGHQSCLLLTSREKPHWLGGIEGLHSAVRSTILSGLEETTASKILDEKALAGSKEVLAELVNRYSGNPLALKFVSETIRELFNANVSNFLKLGKAIFGNIRTLLDEQFVRLSPLEKQIMFWLAIEREPVSIEDLTDDLLLNEPTSLLLEALGHLRRRSLIETSEVANLFTQQPVVMEYVLDIFIEQVCEELKTGQLKVLRSHSLMKAQTRETVRNKQISAILRPVLERLSTIFSNQGEVEKHLTALLQNLKNDRYVEQGYAPGNIINLLCQLTAELRKHDFSGLNILQANFQGVLLHHVNFYRANIEKSIFAETFNNILSVAFSPNGQYLAASNSNGEIRLWRLSDNQQILTFKGHNDWVSSIKFSPDGNYLASSSHDRMVKLWLVRNGKCLNTFMGHSDFVHAIAFSPDGQYLVSGSKDRTIRVWEIETGQCLRVLEGHNDSIWSLAFSPNGQWLVSGSEDETIGVWDINTGERLEVVWENPAKLRTLVFSPDGQYLAGAGYEQVVRLWDVQSGKCQLVLRGHTGFIHSVYFNPDEHILASGSTDKTIRLWNTENGSCRKILQGHNGRVSAVAFSNDGRRIASGSEDQTVRLWDYNSGICLKTWRGYSDGIKAMAITTDGRYLASGGDLQLIKLWEFDSGNCIQTFKGHSSLVWSVAFSPDGKLLASVSHDLELKIWEVSSGEVVGLVDGQNGLNWMVTFSPTGRYLATASLDSTIKLWDLQNLQSLPTPYMTIKGHKGFVWSVAFSPDGRLIASGGDDHSVGLWEVSSGNNIKLLQAHTGLIWSIAFSPDGNLLASGSDDFTIRLWDIADGQCVRVLYGHTNRIRTVAFSPDGKFLASGGFDRILRIWDVKSGRCLKEIPAHNNTIYSIIYKPFEPMLITASADGTIKFWDTQSFQCVNTLKNSKPYEGMNINSVTGLLAAQKDNLKELGAIEMIDNG